MASNDDLQAVTSSVRQPPTDPQPPVYSQPQYQPNPPQQQYQHTYQPQPATYQYQQQPATYQPIAYGSPTPNTQYVVVAGGGCPRCSGYIQEDYTCLGICCAILFFPIGLVCCVLMRERRCANCGYSADGV